MGSIEPPMTRKKIYSVPPGHTRKQLPKKFRTSSPKAPSNAGRNQPCGCGSGRSFQACCYRPDHRQYSLDEYLARFKIENGEYLKSLREDLVVLYERDPAVRAFADSVSKVLDFPTLAEIVHGSDWFETRENTFQTTVHFETLAVDRVLPGREVPLLVEDLQLNKDVLPLRMVRFLRSFAGSQFGIYEVIDARKPRGRERATWYLLKDLFTGEEVEFKDPVFAGQLRKWDWAVGRLVDIQGFHVFWKLILFLQPFTRYRTTRYLLYYWWRWEMQERGRTMEDLVRHYPVLVHELFNAPRSLEYSGLCVPALQEFLKQNAPVLYRLHELVEEAEENYINDRPPTQKPARTPIHEDVAVLDAPIDPEVTARLVGHPALVLNDPPSRDPNDEIILLYGAGERVLPGPEIDEAELVATTLQDLEILFKSPLDRFFEEIRTRPAPPDAFFLALFPLPPGETVQTDPIDNAKGIVAYREGDAEIVLEAWDEADLEALKAILVETLPTHGLEFLNEAESEESEQEETGSTNSDNPVHLEEFPREEETPGIQSGRGPTHQQGSSNSDWIPTAVPAAISAVVPPTPLSGSTKANPLPEGRALPGEQTPGLAALDRLTLSRLLTDLSAPFPPVSPGAWNRGNVLNLIAQASHPATYLAEITKMRENLDERLSGDRQSRSG